MDNYEDFLTALQEACDRAGSANRLAKMAGLNTSAITRWLTRERTPKLDGIAPLLPFIDWPKRGKERRQNSQSALTVIGECDEMPLIPVFGMAGAGNPMEDLWADPPQKRIPIPPSYATKDTVAIEICGNSMEPTIVDGAYVGVRPIDGPLKEGAVYIVRLPSFGLVCKRVKANGLNGITLVSDNPEYAPINVPTGECDGILVGRVVWCLQEM